MKVVQKKVFAKSGSHLLFGFCTVVGDGIMRGAKNSAPVEPICSKIHFYLFFILFSIHL